MTSERQRSCTAEPVIALFVIPDISSKLLTFVSAPGLICIHPVIIFRVFLSRDSIFCFRSSSNFYFHKQLFSATFNLFSNFFFFFFSSLFLSSLLSIADYISYSRFRQRPRRMSASVSIFFLRSSCFGIGFVFSLLVDTACCKSVGESYDDDD